MLLELADREFGPQAGTSRVIGHWSSELVVTCDQGDFFMTLTKTSTMTKTQMRLACSWAAVVLLASSARAETTVTLTGVHLCCAPCVQAINEAVKEISGAKVKADRETRSVTITADNAATAQKAVDTIADAGFHGTSDHDTVRIPDNRAPKRGSSSVWR
jgi:copper chaperone CopZ